MARKHSKHGPYDDPHREEEETATAVVPCWLCGRPTGRQEYATIGNTVTLNIAKARRELGYAPVISRAEGLAELAAAGS